MIEKHGKCECEAFEKVMTKLRGSRPSEKEIDEVFTDMDTDKNQIIDEKEFVDVRKVFFAFLNFSCKKFFRFRL